MIQKYWLRKEDVVEEDGKTYKKISFPPNEGMKDVEMEPAYGTYNWFFGIVILDSILSVNAFQPASDFPCDYPGF